VYDLTLPVITIGRDVSNAIIIGDAEVSRKHARLTSQSGSYLIEDLGSTNGTMVNAQRLLGPHLLRPGEIIILGENISLEFYADSFDPDATLPLHPADTSSYPEPAPVPASVQPAPIPIPPPRPVEYPIPPAPVQPQTVYPEPTPVYAGQVPPGPVEPAQVDEEKPKRRTWMFIGCGCLVIMLCCLMSAAFVFDYLNLYCSTPFQQLFPGCP
jgi:predicted component of type VI protein secretion system